MLKHKWKKLFYKVSTQNPLRCIDSSNKVYQVNIPAEMELVSANRKNLSGHILNISGRFSNKETTIPLLRQERCHILLSQGSSSFLEKGLMDKTFLFLMFSTKENGWARQETKISQSTSTRIKFRTRILSSNYSATCNTKSFFEFWDSLFLLFSHLHGVFKIQSDVESRIWLPKTQRFSLDARDKRSPEF